MEPQEGAEFQEVEVAPNHAQTARN
jgi:hypothetical protein